MISRDPVQNQCQDTLTKFGSSSSHPTEEGGGWWEGWWEGRYSVHGGETHNCYFAHFRTEASETKLSGQLAILEQNLVEVLWAGLRSGPMTLQSGGARR